MAPKNLNAPTAQIEPAVLAPPSSLEPQLANAKTPAKLNAPETGVSEIQQQTQPTKTARRFALGSAKPPKTHSELLRLKQGDREAKSKRLTTALRRQTPG
jgi:hypothetical protein